RQLHALADEALDYHRRVIRAGEAGPALDSTAVRDFERRLAEVGSDHPELSEMLGESLVGLTRRADEMARQRGGEEEVRADRERRVEIAYQAAWDRGDRGSQDDFIQNYLEGRVLEGGYWQRVDVTSQAARLPADADSATALQ